MYTVEEGKGAGDIVIGGFENGIGASPYTGITDLRNVDPANIPGEASVSYVVNPKYECPTGTSLSATAAASGSNFSLTTTTPLESWQAVYITNAGTTGLSTTTVYWVSDLNNSYSGGVQSFALTNLYGDSGTFVSPTAGTITFSVYTLSLGPRGQITKNYMVESQDGYHWLLDSTGLLWTDRLLTDGGTGITNTSSWTYAGNIGSVGISPDPAAFGNGLVYFQPTYAVSSSPQLFDGYIFIFRQQQIDYLKVISAGSTIAPQTLSFSYNWQSGFELNLALLWGESVAYPHEAIQTPDGRIVFTDAYVIDYFYQNSVDTTFDPTNSSTYTFVHSTASSTMPPSDIGLCIAYNPNQTLIVGGMNDVAYVFDITSSPPYQLSSLILLPENLTRNVVTVANNTYLFTGPRGRIYITNGSQANLFAKVPDHISNTVAPYFQWGAATSVNNKLVFGIYMAGTGVTPNTSNNYGGVWMLDISTQAMYVANGLTSDFKDYCCALLPMTNKEYAGNGIIGAWKSSTSYTWGSSGIFTSANNPSQTTSWVTSDLIPIGLAIDPVTPTQIEFRLSQPLQTGDYVEIQVGNYLDMTYASFKTCTFNGATTFTTTGVISGITDGMPDINYQWIVVRAILHSATTASPSYCRITQLRVKNATPKLSAFYMQE